MTEQMVTGALLGLWLGLVVGLLIGALAWAERVKILDQAHNEATALLTATKHATERLREPLDLREPLEKISPHGEKPLTPERDHRVGPLDCQFDRRLYRGRGVDG